MFIGAAGGIALSHLPGLPMVAGAAIGIGALMCAMLNLPLTSVLVTTLLLASDGLAVMPLVIVAVVVAYVARARLPQLPRPDRATAAGRARTGPGARIRGPADLTSAVGPAAHAGHRAAWPRTRVSGLYRGPDGAAFRPSDDGRSGRPGRRCAHGE